MHRNKSHDKDNSLLIGMSGKEAVDSARTASKDARAAMAAVDDCWQPQKGQLCGWHAVRVVLCVLKNNSISRDKFNKDMMPSKENQEGMGINSDTIRGILYKSDKGYTIDAITNVLTRNHLDVQHIFADLHPASHSTPRGGTPGHRREERRQRRAMVAGRQGKESKDTSTRI